MSNWKSLLKADPTGWLLEKHNPSMRYFTLTDSLGKSIDRNRSAMSSKPMHVIAVTTPNSMRQKAMWLLGNLTFRQ